MAAAFLLGSCQKSADPVARGKAYFMGYGCNRCHSLDGRGGAYGPDLTLIGFRKTKEFLDVWLKNPRAWKKNTAMPDFKFTDEARGYLVEYLSSLKGQGFEMAGRPWNSPDLMSDPVKRGEFIFKRAGCVGCHAHSGKGGYPNNNVAGGQIPPLTLAADGFSREEMKERIKTGRKPDKADPKGPDPYLFMPPWGEVLKDDEIEAVVEYIYSLRPAQAAGEQW